MIVTPDGVKELRADIDNAVDKYIRALHKLQHPSGNPIVNSHPSVCRLLAESCYESFAKDMANDPIVKALFSMGHNSQTTHQKN